MQSLKDQCVLVMSGSSGIGLATAVQAVMFLVTTPFTTGSTERVDGGGAFA